MVMDYADAHTCSRSGAYRSDRRRYGDPRCEPQFGPPRSKRRTDHVLRCSDAPIALIFLDQDRNRPVHGSTTTRDAAALSDAYAGSIRPAA
jgi:hypothetical protein